LPGRKREGEISELGDVSWPPHYQELLKWQWEKVATPFWTKRAKFAEEHGVKIALEMHPGFWSTIRTRC